MDGVKVSGVIAKPSRGYSRKGEDRTPPIKVGVKKTRLNEWMRN